MMLGYLLRVSLCMSNLRASRRRMSLVLVFVTLVCIFTTVFFLLPSAMLPKEKVALDDPTTHTPRWIISRTNTAITGWKRIHELWEMNQKDLDEYKQRDDEDLRARNMIGMPKTAPPDQLQKQSQRPSR